MRNPPAANHSTFEASRDHPAEVSRAVTNPCAVEQLSLPVAILLPMSEPFPYPGSTVAMLRCKDGSSPCSLQNPQREQDPQLRSASLQNPNGSDSLKLVGGVSCCEVIGGVHTACLVAQDRSLLVSGTRMRRWRMTACGLRAAARFSVAAS